MVVQTMGPRIGVSTAFALASAVTIEYDWWRLSPDVRLTAALVVRLRMSITTVFALASAVGIDGDRHPLSAQPWTWP